MANQHPKTSPYYATPMVAAGTHLDVLRLRTVGSGPGDIEEYEVPPAFAGRPDLLANHFYGDPRLWWVFMAANVDSVLDPLTDLSAGAVIRVPDPERILTEIGP